ncbi:MAG: glycosyltransferase family 4 protein [Desulfobacterales bacterium]|nr:MAG: glycosyltransferase family 4 protein [Desulfobacterales bacterium]
MLGSYPPLRGLSSYCFEIARALADLVNVEFISFKKIYPGFIYPGGGLKNDPTFPSTLHCRLRVKRRLTWYNPFTWLAEGLLTRADLLHAQWWSLPLAVIYACICLAFKMRRKPVVFTVHNVLSHERSKIYATVSRLLFKLGDHFIVHTSANRRQMTTCYLIAPERVSLIPHGSLDFHVQSGTDRESIRSRMGFAPTQRVILLFGAIRPYKGVATALRAFAQVLKKIPQARLLIAGKLWESWTPYQQIIDKFEIGECVKLYLDYIPSGEVHRYFAAADLVVLPYHHFDSQSGVGSTAVSFRKPMIVTNVGGLPELVNDPRLIVPPQDPAALAEAMRVCLEDPHRLKEMSATTETVAAGLSWPPIAKMTYTVYEYVLANKLANFKKASG